MDEKLKKQIDFVLEIDKLKNVSRQTRLTNLGRKENDAEHSWHIALMAYLFKEYSNVEIDITKVMLMCLIHDIVEIDAGDTYAYDEQSVKTQKERENSAKERIFSILPKEQSNELKNLFEEFESFETPESKFAHAMDNFQPLLLNNSNEGEDWKEHNVLYSQVYNRQKKTKFGSEKLFVLSEKILEDNLRKGNLKP